MSKFVCSVCGYVYEGDAAPEKCPVCKAPASKFNKVEAENSYATVHMIGEGGKEKVEADVYEGLVNCFSEECKEVGMYLAMARAAEREGYPEVAAAFEKYAGEKAEHAGKYAELLGEIVSPSTKKNLESRADAEAGSCSYGFGIAKRAKALGYDAVHDTVHEMAKDEARYAAGFEGLLKRYFGDK